MCSTKVPKVRRLTGATTKAGSRVRLAEVTGTSFYIGVLHRCRRSSGAHSAQVKGSAAGRFPQVQLVRRDDLRGRRVVAAQPADQQLDRSPRDLDPPGIDRRQRRTAERRLVDVV